MNMYTLVILITTQFNGEISSNSLATKYEDMAACIKAGEKIKSKFELTTRTLKRTVKYTCTAPYGKES